MTRVRRNPDSPDSVRARLAAIATERRVDFQAVLLTAVENGGAGRSKMVALGGVDLP
jgi:hypothetical protein